ncbi:MAG: DUF2213 domain-containing protein [Hyphomicrobium sp.]
MLVRDRIALDATSPRKTAEGYLVARVKIARLGVQEYTGARGRPARAMAKARIQRPEAEVFSTDSLRSYAGAPLTLNHPPVTVTAENYRRYAVGARRRPVRAGRHLPHGRHYRAGRGGHPRDRGGHQELSVGYDCDLDWTSGAADGEKWDAEQKRIRANHLSIVAAARGGPALSIGL